MNNIKSFKCPFCEQQYDNLDNMYQCAKKDEAKFKKLELRKKEEYLLKQKDEQLSVLSQKLDELKEEIDKYNAIVEGTKYPKIEQIYKINFIDNNEKKEKNKKNINTFKIPLGYEQFNPINMSLEKFLDTLFDDEKGE